MQLRHQRNSCGQIFRDKNIIDHAVQALADSQNVRIVRDVQVHYWNHCKPCFKVSSKYCVFVALDSITDPSMSGLHDAQSTVRTPKGSVCRLFKPEEVNLGATTIENGTNLRLHRPIGCEYVNPYNPVVMATLKCNHDAQFVLSGAKDIAAYIAKYCFKKQYPVETMQRYHWRHLPKPQRKLMHCRLTQQQWSVGIDFWGRWCRRSPMAKK